MRNSALDILSQKKQYKYPYFLLGLYLTFMLSTVCLANRITAIGYLLEPGGIFAFPITFSICDIVGEVYGYTYPRLFIWIGIIAEFIFAMIVTMVSHLPAPVFFEHAHAYQIVFDPTLRYVGAGLIGLIVGEFVNIYLLAKWKVFFLGRLFVVRSLIATALGQACLTVIVDLLIYLGKLDASELWQIMLHGYFWKIMYALIMVFPAWLVVNYLKRVERIDHYDINTNFNPFIFSLTGR